MVHANLLGTHDVLTTMITPAVLISASGTLVLSTTNRLGRVVDRIRKLTETAELLPDESTAIEVVEKRRMIADQLSWLTIRLRLLQTTIFLFYASMALLVAASLTLGLSVTTQGALGWFPISLAMLGAFGLMVGAGILVCEVRAAVKSTMSELDHIRKVVARKTTVKSPPHDKPENAGT
jgi:hypothetical protein